MNENNVTQLVQPGKFTDLLTEIVRGGARSILAQAVEIEAAQFLKAHEHLTTQDGRQRLVRHGHLPERQIQTGIGPVTVKKPRMRDRCGSGKAAIKYTSAILPPYIRRSKSLEELIPALYLRGISTGDFQEVLSTLLGTEAPNLSHETIRRLKSVWKDEWKKWRKRDLSAKHYVYIWADGVYLNARMDDKQCILVIIGATPEGKKELLGFVDGYRESTQSWRELLLDLKARGLVNPPKLATGDGALGFWKALGEIFSATRHQRCWVHKTANVLNKFPKSIQKKAKADLKEIWMAESRTDAIAAFDLFLNKYSAKYDKATKCLEKDRDQLLSFYDFPAEHWKHIRTSNPIESVFASVRHRTIKTKGSLSRETALSMVFKLVMAAQKRWQRLSGRNELPKLIEGVKFADGIEVKDELKQTAA
ncbi:MAG: IS256 family transposase [Proteobacteria bacterium]|nr:IS256 family transposase [Pseudomonadota bacterium]